MPKGTTLWRHNLTDKQYDDLWNRQGGRCALCFTESAKLVIDHDHSCCGPSTGFNRTCGNCIRGLVCYRCNNFLGYLEGTPIDVLARSQYIYGKTPTGVSTNTEIVRVVDYLTLYLSKDALEGVA